MIIGTKSIKTQYLRKDKNGKTLFRETSESPGVHIVDFVTGKIRLMYLGIPLNIEEVSNETKLAYLVYEPITSTSAVE